jgi:hypothetical protein
MGSFGVRPSNLSLAQLGRRFVGLNTIGPARSLTRGAFFGWRLSLCQPTESSAHRRRHGSSKIKFVCSKKNQKSNLNNRSAKLFQIPEVADKMHSQASLESSKN